MQPSEFEIANALTRTGSVFSRRRWICVPNVSWGWGLDYEADLIVVSSSNIAQEVEIKISAADLRADRRKLKHGRLDPRIRKFWYAVPVELVDVALEEGVLSSQYGLIEVEFPKSEDDTWLPKARIAIPACTRNNYRKCTDAEVYKLLQLSQMRYWDRRLREGGAGS